MLRYVNLMITMLLGGLWHGAAWTFVVWGALHGAYLCINHAFNALVPNIPSFLARPVRIAGAVLTFLAVVVAWVFFRAERVDWALLVLNAMADPSNIVFGREEIAALVLVSIYAALVWLAPNTQGIMGYDHGNRRVGEAPEGRTDAAAVPLWRVAGACVRDSRHPEPQRIHLFPVLMRGTFTHLRRLLLASIACVLGAAALTFVVDPLQLFRPSRLVAPFYSDDTRVQNAGLIRSQSFDTAFMGTSLAIHFRQSDIDRALGVHSLKLAMTGSNSRQQGFVLEQAIERGARRVIWAMDDFIFVDAADIETDPYLSVDLYRRTTKGIASYLFSAAMAKESLFALLRSVPPLRQPLTRAAPFLPVKFALSDVDDIYALPRDFDVARAYNAERTLAAFAYITSPVRSRFLGEGYGYDAMVRHFERRCRRPDHAPSGRDLRHLLPALFDPAIRRDARCFACDAEDRHRSHGASSRSA